MADISVGFTLSDAGAYAQTFDISIELGLGKRAKRAHVIIVIDTIKHPATKPKTGELLTISGDLEFKGPLVTVADRWLNPDTYEVTVEAVDFTPLLDAHLVTKDFEIQTLSERVQEALSLFCPGFTLGVVDSDIDDEGDPYEDPPELEAQGVDHKEASAFFDELAELTDQTFELKFDKTVNFLQLGEPAPLAGIVVEDEDYVSDCVVTEDWSDLHNVLVIKDFTLRSAYSYEERFPADGAQSFFSLSMPPWAITDTQVSISKDGGGSFVDRESRQDLLGVQSEYEMYRPEDEEPEVETEEHRTQRRVDLELERQAIIDGAEGEAYVCVWNVGVRFPLDDLPEEGDIVRVIYAYERQQQVLESRNLTSIAVIGAREDSDGIHERCISLPELRATTLQSAKNYTEMLLARAAWPILTGSFQTYVTGWEPGQKFELSSATREIENPRPGGGVVEAWVTRVTKRITAYRADDIFLIDHLVEFTSQPQSFPISLDEFLHRLIDHTSHIRPPGTVYPGPTTSTSTTTTTLLDWSTTSTSTSTATTLLERPILLEEATP